MQIYQFHNPVGSNPGGKVNIPLASEQAFYMKYVNGVDHRKIPPNAPWDFTKQPIYEALTLALCKTLGLLVPRSWVLKGHNLDLHYHSDVTKRISPGKPYYFLSQFVEKHRVEDEISLEERMQLEKPYRDLLMVSDIEGRAQNYRLIDDKGTPKLVYVDCGCSFVDAKDGRITQRQELQKLLTNGAKLNKRLRQARRTLEKTGIITNHYDLHQSSINAAALVDSIPLIHIPFFPHDHVQTAKLLSSEEMEIIQALFSLNIAQVIRKRAGRKDVIIQ